MPRRPLAALPVALAAALVAASLVALATAPTARAQPAPDPFAGVAHLDGDALRKALHGVLQGSHRRLSWDATKQVIIAADRAALPLAPPHILDIYSNTVLLGEAPGRDAWDREHVWPASLMGWPAADEDDRCNIPYTDAHLLFAAASAYNQSRGNLWFDDVDTGVCAATPRCEKPVASSPAPNRRLEPAWEVWPGRRGDVARALLYVDVRYAGGIVAGGCEEHDLVLTDTLAAVVTATTRVTTAHMGRLSTLVRWHLEDPVGAQDRQHNEAVAARQANRNPFTDRPEFVCRVWSVGVCATWRPRVWLPWAERP